MLILIPIGVDQIEVYVNEGTGGAYRHFIPQLTLSIERNTLNVPNDGRFYLIRDGCIIDSFQSIKKAEERFRQLVKETGFKPEVAEQPGSAIDESMQRYQMAKDLFWAEGPKYKRKGGKGGRGGV